MTAAEENEPRRVGTIWTLDLDEPASPITPAIDVTFRRLGLESTEALAVAMGEDHSGEISKRLAAGKRCYAAWARDCLAAYGWVSFFEENVGELGLQVKLGTCEAYIWDCATLPEYRNQGLYSALLVYILGELRAEQVCRAWIGAGLDNAPSQRGIDRAGFKRVADLAIAWEKGTRQIWALGYPGIPESLMEEARRVYLNEMAMR